MNRVGLSRDVLGKLQVEDSDEIFSRFGEGRVFILQCKNGSYLVEVGPNSSSSQISYHGCPDRPGRFRLEVRGRSRVRVCAGSPDSTFLKSTDGSTGTLRTGRVLDGS